MIANASIFGQNPISRDQFTADPTNRALYHDSLHVIQGPEGKGLRKVWFCIEEYHVFSPSNQTR